MEKFILGFLTGGSLILAIGPQNLFVIEQGLKKKFVFVVTTICSLSDILLIYFGIFLYYIFDSINYEIQIFLNIILILFLLNFIKEKIYILKQDINLNNELNENNLKKIILKTLGFTYLNPHVYSDTILILGNLSKNYIFTEKIYFGLGASIASIIYFYLLGYSSSFFSNLIVKKLLWRYINIFIIIFMTTLVIYVSYELASLIIKI